uniref:Putative secreted protein n=1 Tax=Ixodes ricinus TaxID=34613 RepID=A0A6B0UR46_IXORI
MIRSLLWTSTSVSAFFSTSTAALERAAYVAKAEHPAKSAAEKRCLVRLSLLATKLFWLVVMRCEDESRTQPAGTACGPDHGRSSLRTTRSWASSTSSGSASSAILSMLTTVKSTRQFWSRLFLQTVPTAAR